MGAPSDRRGPTGALLVPVTRFLGRFRDKVPLAFSTRLSALTARLPSGALRVLGRFHEEEDAGAKGNVLVHDGARFVRLSVGSNDHVLTADSAEASGVKWAAASGGGGGGSGTVTSVAAGTGLSGGTITSSGTIALADTSVSAGTYTAADITVDAQGRLTAAASGTIGTAEIANDAVTADKLADTSVSAGSYTSANITVDAQGRLTAAANGTGGGGGTTDHAALSSNLAWSSSGHTGTDGKAAGFGGGSATELELIEHPFSGRRIDLWMPYLAHLKSPFGYNPSASGTRTQRHDDDGAWVEYKTGTSGAYSTHVCYPNDDFCETRNDPKAAFSIMTGSDIDGIRMWFLWSGNPPSNLNDEDPSGPATAGVRFNSRDGDTKWVAYARDGTNRTKTDTGITVAADTVYFFEILVDQAAGTVTVRIKATMAGTWDTTVVSSNLPPSDEELGFVLRLYATNGSDRRIFKCRAVYLSSE